MEHERETIEKRIMLDAETEIYLMAHLDVDSAPEAAKEKLRKDFAAFWNEAVETVRKAVSAV